MRATIYVEVAEQLALSLAFGGTRGSMPGWYQTMRIAEKLGVPAWDLEAEFALRDPSITVASREEWINRALTAMHAEEEARARLRVREMIGGKGIAGGLP